MKKSASTLKRWDMDFELVPLNELLITIVDNRGKTCPTADSGIPLIATNCINNDCLYPSHEKLRFVSQQTYKEWFRGHPKPGDIIFVNKGTPGRCCWVPDPVDFCIAQDMVALRVDEKKVYPKFLLALLRSNDVQNLIANMHVGTLIPHFKKGDFDKLLLKIPLNRKFQEFVGDIYFDISKRIELNQRMSATLEGIAQALFKSWFVDFDPVRAKVEGFQPEGLSDDFSALFPNSFEDDKPKGWSEESIYSCAEYINGAAYKDMHFSDAQDALPVIKIAELKNGVGQGTKYTNTDLGGKYLINTGEILFSWSGSPETSIDAFLWVGGDAWLNQHIFRVVTSSPETRTFVFFLLKHLKPVFIATAKNKQTTGLGHVTVQDLKRLKIVYPSIEVLNAFAAIATPILDRLQHNLEQIALLSSLRNELLPKLISGKLRIDEISEVAEAVAL